jgi:hypothetical protein
LNQKTKSQKQQILQAAARLRSCLRSSNELRPEPRGEQHAEKQTGAAKLESGGPGLQQEAEQAGEDTKHHSAYNHHKLLIDVFVLPDVVDFLDQALERQGLSVYIYIYIYITSMPTAPSL